MLMQKVFRKAWPHHFNLCCCTDTKEEACCPVKDLDLLIFYPLPSCGPPQSSHFRTFYTSHCLGPSDGNHSGQDFILLTDAKASTGYWNHQCGAEMPTENVGALGAAQGCESGHIINKVEGGEKWGWDWCSWAFDDLQATHWVSVKRMKESSSRKKQRDRHEKKDEGSSRLVPSVGSFAS